MNRTQAFTPTAVLPPAETDTRSRQAWLASKRQELLAPAGALLDLSEMLLGDAADCGHPEFLRDQQEVHRHAAALTAMLQELLHPQNAGGAADLARRARDDLRTPLTVIIGLCEDLLEDVSDPHLQGVFPRAGEYLQEMVRHARKLEADLNGILDFGKVASDPDIDLDQLAAEQVDLFRDLFDSLPDAAGKTVARPRETGVVLVVEDNPVNRDRLVRRLVRDGHTVVEAADGRQGLALARSRPFDLILLDVIMPELNGLQMLEQLKADPRLRSVPVIMISAFHELDGVVRCLEMGAEDYLAKPFNPVLLRARIDGCLEKKRLRNREASYREEIERQRKQADELMRRIAPEPAGTERKPSAPRRYDDVAVLFCDVVGFNPFAAGAQPEEVVGRLQTLIESFEEIAQRHGVEKIKTIGNVFMGAAGLLPGGEPPVLVCVRCGLDMIAACRELPVGWDLRAGVDVGPVLAGMIGRRPPLFDLWGDTVSTAAAMLRDAAPGAMMLTAAAWRCAAPSCRGETCGLVAVKGKGTVEMFRVDGVSLPRAPATAK